MIELLVVIAIMAIVTAVSLPAFVSMRRASDLTGAGNRIADLASQARQRAVGGNTIEALVVATGTGGLPATQSALTLLEMAADGTWSPAVPWAILPATVRIVDGTPDAAALPGGPAPSLQLQAQRVDWNRCDVLLFYPDGRMRGDAGSLRQIQVRLASDGTGAAPRNSYNLLFHADTAAVQIVRP